MDKMWPKAVGEFRYEPHWPGTRHEWLVWDERTLWGPSGDDGSRIIHADSEEALIRFLSTDPRNIEDIGKIPRP